MELLRTAQFATLFIVTFVVAATFQIAMAFVGLIIAMLTPSFFKMNGAPAANTAQAVVVLILILLFVLLLNAAMSAAGSGIWLATRRLILRKR